MFSISELSLASCKPKVLIKMPWFGIDAASLQFRQATAATGQLPQNDRVIKPGCAEALQQGRVGGEVQWPLLGARLVQVSAKFCAS